MDNEYGRKFGQLGLRHSSWWAIGFASYGVAVRCGARIFS
jgi:hypothetical protein